MSSLAGHQGAITGEHL